MVAAILTVLVLPLACLSDGGNSFQPIDVARGRRRDLGRQSALTKPRRLFSLYAAAPRETRREKDVAASAPPQSGDDLDEAIIRLRDGVEKFFAGLRQLIRNLAQLSLKDYEWRSDVFKTNQADRMVEESIARLTGEDASYVRPMDASENRIGPLGKWEKSAVEWLSDVIDEEGRRARQIVDSDGKLVRPINAGKSVGAEMGPLGYLEQKVVDCLESVLSAETERVRTNTLRPKDLDESLRGPLGDMELEAVRVFEAIQESERVRAEQSRQRGGEVVRPIDVPGPLGEFEMAVLEIVDAEKKRSEEREENDGAVVRPMNAQIAGPLGEAELRAYQAIKAMNEEEMERLRSIRRILQENRPMESENITLLGVLETFLVGLLRGPQLLFRVVGRVQELLRSETLGEAETEETGPIQSGKATKRPGQDLE